MGFKRSEKRMQADRGAAARGHGAQRDHGRGGRRRSSSRSRRSRSTGFPSRTRRASRCSSTRARTSRRTIPAAFYAALLNNQPMGFYHPATLVKDAQRHGVRFAPDRRAALELGVRRSRRTAPCAWGCGYVNGLRRQVGQAIAGSIGQGLGAQSG